MKRIKLFLSIIITVFLLTSCLNYNQVTTLKTDNSGKMFIHYWIKMEPEFDSLLIKKIGIFNKESIEERIKDIEIVN